MDNQLRRAGRERRPTESFKTPEQIAARDSSTASPLLINKTLNQHASKRKRKFWPLTKKARIIVVAAVIVLAAIGFLCFQLFANPPKKVVKNVFTAKAEVKKSLTVASSLTGLQVSPAANQLPITAVMIENSTDARPQSGLGEAGVVFEALAEGGITRFVALFQSNASTSLGPVRSARPYFISWMLGFDADYAHVGGSPEALSDISSWGVKDMDQFYNGSYYQRISSRAAPHNVYTTLAELYQLEQSKDYLTSSFTSWTRKNPAPLAKPTTASIALTLAGADYNVNYTYDQATNSYERSVGGAPQVDADTNQQISVPVVIAIVVSESNGPLDSSNAYYSEYQTIGSGTAYVFQDGGVTVGQWSKSSNNSQILFTTSSGKTLPLNPGEVWVTAVTSSSNVSYN